MNETSVPPRVLGLLSRRELLRRVVPGAVALRLFGGSILLGAAREGFAATAEVPETEDNIEGPYYKAGAPFHSNLVETGMRGTPLRMFGRVLDTRGQPLKGALLDIWHANDSGEYDNKGFAFRGRVSTDDLGRYELLTIKPKWYGTDGDIRPAHIHVKASAPGIPLLTTQLYFKGDPYNVIDPWVRPSLILSPRRAADGLTARFYFVLKRA